MPTINKNHTMAPIEFYNKTKEFLDKMASAYGITDLGRYYRLTDPQSEWYRALEESGADEISICFAQLACHAQNAYLISNIVKFEKNFDFLRRVCEGFNPTKFHEKYPEESSVIEVVNALSYTIEKGEGLEWKSPNNNNTIVRRYATALIRGANYLRQFGNKKELLADLSRYGEFCINNEDSLIKYFMSDNVMGKSSGFSVALTCDFLKELDKAFQFLAKPDVHIMEVTAAYYQLKEEYYKSPSKALECLRDFQGIVGEINNELPENQRITVYQFDRMIWLICSGKFFLDNIDSNKQAFIRLALG